MPLPAGASDMVILHHELGVAAGAGRPAERITSTLLARGDATSTAMARTVGLPTAIAAELVLGGEITVTGSRIPTHPSIYRPVLRELAREGLAFAERREPQAGEGPAPAANGAQPEPLEALP